jgi:hypothetical protein
MTEPWLTFEDVAEMRFEDGVDRVEVVCVHGDAINDPYRGIWTVQLHFYPQPWHDNVEYDEDGDIMPCAIVVMPPEQAHKFIFMVTNAANRATLFNSPVPPPPWRGDCIDLGPEVDADNDG